MYLQIINEINSFLDKIFVSSNIINPDEFQGVFVKKLSNQNIIKEKRRVNAGETMSTVNQTHIDITGQHSKLFFFNSLNDRTTAAQNVDIDLYENNFKFLNAINDSHIENDSVGNSFYVRSSTDLPAELSLGKCDKIIHSSAYKKYGHTGNQIQINIPNLEEPFTAFHHLAFQDDALIFLKYDLMHYMSILIPVEFCSTLYSITKTHGNKNINVPISNPNYNQELARQIQQKTINHDLLHDEVDIDILQSSLMDSPTTGADIKRIVKTRVSQGAFRRLLLLKRHQCQLCNVTTTAALRASHIKEWADSSREERMDAENGLLLCANHDALFDRHLISFEPNTGKICISESLDENQRDSLFLNSTVSIPISVRMKLYMEVHYKKFKENEGL